MKVPVAYAAGVLRYRVQGKSDSSEEKVNDHTTKKNSVFNSMFIFVFKSVFISVLTPMLKNSNGVLVAQGV